MPQRKGKRTELDMNFFQMRNYELGIVFTLPADGLERAIDNVVCWKRPARSYGTDVPWVRLLHLPLLAKALSIAIHRCSKFTCSHEHFRESLEQ